MHIPVLLNEVIKNLNPQPNENFIDATVGEAGHTICLLQKTSPSGRILGIDLDSEALRSAEEKAKAFLDRVVFVQNNFKNIENIVEEQKFKNIKGVLFDLGINSYQIDDSGRGFTFKKDEPLLMNLGRDVELTAEEIVNNWSEKDLTEMIKNYGEERYASSIAKAIVDARKNKPIKTTFGLVEAIKKAVPDSYERGRIHPATRTFQAIRIAVNDELNNLRKGLETALKVIDSGGKIAVISFHSLEDRIVKNFFRDNKSQLEIITKKPIIPIDVEILNNPRARSAKLRVAKKL